MKKINFLPLVITLLFASALQAQTVDEIIAKHIDAIGGKEKLNQVKSIYTEISVDVMGNTAPTVEYLLAGKGYKAETDFNGSKIVNCINDKGGWTINPMMGGTDPQPMPDVLYKAGKDQIYVGGALVDYAAKGYTVELVGKEGSEFKLKISNEGNESFYFFDPATYHITKVTSKSEMMGQPVEVTTTFADYKKTDFGIVIPYTRNVDTGMFQMTQKVNKVEVNKEIDPMIFEIPK